MAERSEAKSAKRCFVSKNLNFDFWREALHRSAIFSENEVDK